MEISYDPAKNERNVAQRGLSFERGADLDWDTAFAEVDDRKDYGERRLRVFGLLGPRLHVAVIAARGAVIHVISFRKANEREVRQYGQANR